LNFINFEGATEWYQVDGSAAWLESTYFMKCEFLFTFSFYRLTRKCHGTCASSANDRPSAQLRWVEWDTD